MLLAPLRPNAARQRVSDGRAIPAPVKGWNARDELANMDPADAVTLDNFFPDSTTVTLRKGMADHATGMSTAVETLAVWNGPTSSKMFAATVNDIWDVTAAGAVGAAEVSTLTNGRWQHVNMTTSGGQFLLMVNGADDMQNYDGTTWTAINSGSSPAITGVATDELIHLNVHGRRVWAVQANTTKAWYLPVNAIAGAATAFDFGPLFSAGGYLVATGTWTQDGGDGLDDYFVAISSIGQVAVYQGTDPASASTFALVGVFRVGAPIGRRCLMKVGGDLALITQDGVISMGSMVATDRSVAQRVAITDRIRKAFNAAVLTNSADFGWTGIIYPRGTRVLFNVPQVGGEYHQYVMNTITGAWCRFKGWNAKCWALLNEEIYFGGTGTVYKADTGTDDDGTGITYDLKTAFNYFGNRGRLKHFKLLRPLLTANASVSIAVDINLDYEDAAPLNILALMVEGGLWDVAKWDEDVWGGEAAFRSWQTVHGTGHCAAVRVKGTVQGVIIGINAFDIVFELGDVL